MFVKRLAVVVLIVAVLSSLVDTAVAQSEPQQFVVYYVEFKPAGRDVFQQLDAHAEGSAEKHKAQRLVLQTLSIWPPPIESSKDKETGNEDSIRGGRS